MVANDEIGPSTVGVKPDGKDNNHFDTRHLSLWGNLMAGGWGVEYYFGYQYPHSDLNAEDWASRDISWDQARHALQFFNTHLPFTEMRGADELTANESDYVFAKAGEVYAIYLPQAAETSIDLGANEQTYSVNWYNPRRGGALQRGSIEQIHGPGVADIGQPPAEPDSDWVILIKRRLAPPREEVADAMRRATQFMTSKVAVNGGYVWTYLDDFSRRWGEMEAKPSMIWTQAPGTPAMGQIFLDAYHATGEPVFYEAAANAADALIAGQHPSGGWNYVIDFASEESLKNWYATIGFNGWRLEEFQHYYGNATFDDGATYESAYLLLRMYLEKREPRFGAALEKAIGFVLDSQYPSGGWPQRYPPAPEWKKQGHPDYTAYVTLNDGVAERNIGFLLLVLQQLEDERVREPLQRAMDLFIELQQPEPSPGWALQYTHDLIPAAARTYEPRSVSPHTTGSALGRLMDFYELTGDQKYLEPIPAALEWLQKVELPAFGQSDEGRNFYSYIEIGSNRPLAVHRRGSNTQNGKYFVDYDMSDQRPRRVGLAALQQRFERLRSTTPEEATTDSAWFGRGPSLLPDLVVADAFNHAGVDMDISHDRARELVAGLNEEGYWPSSLAMTSHPYKGPGPDAPPPGFVDHGHAGRVGDEWDTSPFYATDPVPGISTSVFIRNMNLLISYLESPEDN
jgi:hypothetical protein